MSLNPWDPGYEAPPPPTAEQVTEMRVRNARNAGRSNAKKAIDKPPAVKLATKSGKPKRVPDPNSETSQRLSRYVEENMQPRSIIFAKKFVTEYLRDWNGPMAYIRAGGSANHAGSGGPETLRWPYVQKLLQHLLEEMDEEDILTRKRIISGILREATYMGPDTSHGARVRAWMGLARIKKMDIQVVENNHHVSGGVMVIPMQDQSKTIDGWAQVTEANQARLKDEVRK